VDRFLLHRFDLEAIKLLIKHLQGEQNFAAD
jgi:hypothetical protein